jgi:ribulose-5-phosphate 4-epimerase/fuculose-1-phosphate aldolase
VSIELLQQVCDGGQSFFDRGYAFGSTGNLSVRIDDRLWITPTGLPLKGLTPALLAEVDAEGRSLNGNKPSKEFPFHLAMYRRRLEARAIVHLHSTYSVALSCLADLDSARPLPALTPYYFMRVAPLGIVPYHRPGSKELADAVDARAAEHHSLLLRNHGLITSGRSWTEAVDRAEELEETAKLYFVLRGERLSELNEIEIREISGLFRRRQA